MLIYHPLEWRSEQTINNKETLLIAAPALSALTDWVPPHSLSCELMGGEER